MDLTFGARLRSQREQQQVALATIAEETKINVALLEGLERDDLSRWPGGLFRRAYVRTYAQKIGLDPEQVVREFIELYPDAVAGDVARGGDRANRRVLQASEDSDRLPDCEPGWVAAAAIRMSSRRTP